MTFYKNRTIIVILVSCEYVSILILQYDRSIETIIAETHTHTHIRMDAHTVFQFIGNNDSRIDKIKIFQPILNSLPAGCHLDFRV